MYLQNKQSVYEIMWNDTLAYGDIYLQMKIEQSKYNFEVSNAEGLTTLLIFIQKKLTIVLKMNLCFRL
jgi:glycyl-tRNA synthetase alpha chain